MEVAMLEKISAKPSRLGFGCMRFLLNADGGIDEPRAEAMLDRAYKAGVNYFDTAYFYHNRTSEEFVGRALKKYPRESFYLATKLPLSMIHSLDEAKEIYEGQFKSLQVEYFDFYLLHCVNAANWKTVMDNGILDYLIEQQKLVAEGAGSVSVAAAMFNKVDLKGKKVVCVVSGGNIDVNTMNRVINRGLLKAGRKATVTIALSDRPGELLKVTEILSKEGANILNVTHKRSVHASTITALELEVEMETRNHAHIEDIRAALTAAGLVLVD